MSKEIIVTIPGQGAELKTPEQLIVEAVDNYDVLKKVNPNLVTRFVSPNSYGLYAGLIIVGAVSLGLGIKLAMDRAAIVKEAEAKREEEGQGRTGMIAVLGKDVNYVTELAARHGLRITNYNGPIAHVLGGLKDRFEAIKQELGAKALELNVEGIYHDILRAGESMLYKERVLDKSEIADPKTPIIFSTRPRIGHTADEVKTELYEQMIYPVDLSGKVKVWQETGVGVVIDIGANQSMKKLTGRMLNGTGIQVLAVADEKDREVIASLR